MIIRRNPLTSREDRVEDKAICALLAINTIEAISGFLQVHTYCPPCGYFIASSLVECIYHVVYTVKDKHLQTSHRQALDSFKTAYQLLEELAVRDNSARKAVRVLKESMLNDVRPSSPLLSDLLDQPEGLDEHNNMGDDLLNCKRSL
jgi:hypothetical protein